MLQVHVIEKNSDCYKDKKGKKPKKRKSQRVNMMKYNRLLAEAENLGVSSINFDKEYSYNKRIKILLKIIEREK